MAIKYLNNVSLENNEIQNVKIQNLASDPIVSGQGQLIFNTASTALKYYDGTSWISVSSSSGTVTSVSGTGTVSGLTLTGTVTNSGNLTLGGSLTLTSGQITSGLGFTPYNETNPAGYTSFAEPGIFSGGGTPTLAAGVTAAEIRTLIGAGTSSTIGTVTSVAATGNDGITVSGSPITSSGTITLGLTNGGIANAKLANSSVTFGSTTVELGNSATAIAGLTSLDFVAGSRTIGSSIGANSLTLGATSSTVVIPGNLTVNGTTTTINSNEVNIGDAIIKLNSDETGAPSQNAGFEIERGTSINVSLLWDETLDRWDFGSAYDVRANTFIGDLNGTASSVAVNSVALGTDTTGNYVQSIVAGNGIDVTAAGEGVDVTITAEIATTTNEGIVELATSVEAITGTDTSRAVTPKAASDMVADRITNAQISTRFTAIMPSATSSYNVPHGFGSAFDVTTSVCPIIVSYFDMSTGEQVMINTVQASIDDFDISTASPLENDVLISVMFVGEV